MPRLPKEVGQKSGTRAGIYQYSDFRLPKVVSSVSTTALIWPKIT